MLVIVMMIMMIVMIMMLMVTGDDSDSACDYDDNYMGTMMII